MFVWENVTPTSLNGITLKMYRPRYIPEITQKVPFKGNELDHIAFEHLGSEIFTYKIMDTNFVSFMEERFDLRRVKEIYAPVKEATI